MEAEVQELLWGAGILALPLLLALPMRLAWSFFIGALGAGAATQMERLFTQRDSRPTKPSLQSYDGY